MAVCPLEFLNDVLVLHENQHRDSWGGVRFIAQYVSQLPIRSASAEAKVRLAELAEGATKVEGAELAEVEGEINRIVFGLFGLSAEEVALVTGE